MVETGSRSNADLRYVSASYRVYSYPQRHSDRSFRERGNLACNGHLRSSCGQTSEVRHGLLCCLPRWRMREIFASISVGYDLDHCHWLEIRFSSTKQMRQYAPAILEVGSETTQPGPADRGRHGNARNGAYRKPSAETRVLFRLLGRSVMANDWRSCAPCRSTRSKSAAKQSLHPTMRAR
jgi:hypothetical protein